MQTIAHADINGLHDVPRPYLPEQLGINEIFFGKSGRCVLTDIGQRRPIDLLPDCKTETVLEWLYPFRDNSTLRYISIDMWRPFQRAVSTIFPDVPVVIDKFHVLKIANTALDKVRATLANERTAEARNKREERLAMAQGRQEMQDKYLLLERPYNLRPDALRRLNVWLERETELKVAYDLKEALAEIYEPGSDKSAIGTAFAIWRASIPEYFLGTWGPFQPLFGVTRFWKTEILAYFDHRQTDAFTETFNKVTKRIYDFDDLRARVLSDLSNPPQRLH